MVRVWNFVLPKSGQHSFRIENIGAQGQRVFLDGTELESRKDFWSSRLQDSFIGPDGVTLKIQQSADQGKAPTSIDKEAKWVLLIDEVQVEEADPSGAALRDLRSMGEGSYIIATGFDAQGVIKHACRKYKFNVDSVPHELDVAHRECVWQVSLDGQLLDQHSHTLNDSFGTVDVKVPGANGAMVPCTLQVSWMLKELKWSYDLVVGGIHVPPYWTKAKGNTVGVAPPAIFSAAPAHADTAPGTRGYPSPTGTAPITETEAPARVIKPDDVVPDILPQGVSYDRETNTFQANIKDAKTKRYICLGEFASADDAHQKYLEALPRYAPDKQLAPALVA